MVKTQLVIGNDLKIDCYIPIMPPEADIRLVCLMKELLIIVEMCHGITVKMNEQGYKLPPTPVGSTSQTVERCHKGKVITQKDGDFKRNNV